MGQHISIPTTGTQCIGGYLAQTADTPNGGIIVIQEIFGVTQHIREVCDDFAAQGFTALAPAFFDRLEDGVELPYDDSGMQRGRALVQELGMQRPVEDLASAREAIASAGRIGTVGYCWGGTIALLAAQRLGMPSVSYYGARNVDYLETPLQAPVMFHFGEKDPTITAQDVARHREQLPDMEVFTYPEAGHGFNRAVPGDAHHHAASADQARERTLRFFQQQLAE